MTPMTRKAPSLRPLLAVATLLAALGAGAAAPAREAPGEDAPTNGMAEHKRVPLPSLTKAEDHPFTIEVPVHWGARRNLPAPGVFLGPPSGTPNSHPEMLLVRETEVALDAPEAILANLRSHAEQAEWSLTRAEVRDFGGVRGLWIVREMPPEGFHGRRMSYAVKLPLGAGSLDVAATVPAEEEETLGRRVEHMLLSLRPAEAEAGPAPADPPG